MANVRYIGPSDEVDIPGIGSCKRGETISVPTDVAGHAPDPRVAVAMTELADAIASIDHDRAQALKNEIIGLDSGAGLLAQSTWEQVTTKQKKDDES